MKPDLIHALLLHYPNKLQIPISLPTPACRRAGAGRQIPNRFQTLLGH
jgi:hypothetical protein